MSDNEVTLAISVPLDSDGFLRRECPTCEREFKWLSSTNEEYVTEPVPDGGYFCPYCGIQAPPSSWFTHAQLELVENMVATEVVEPMLKDFGKTIEGIGRASGGLMTAKMEFDEPDEVDPLTEADDMRRVDFACHPSEPVKVLDDWDKQVRCLLCGRFAA